MSWVRETKRSWLEKFFIKMLQCGEIPRHVAFIMDGNRRYAVKIGIKKFEGHLLGFEKLSETLEWCLDLGIKEVTVYTFSIENFKRSKEEVDTLLDLAREKFKVLLQEKGKLDKYGVCVRILGDITLLPADLQALVAKAVLCTRYNNKLYLNICLAYTSREEMASVVKDIAEGLNEGILHPSDVSEDVFEECLYGLNGFPPDLLIRTSGEVRLSDFLLWQSSYSILAFMEVLWPEFSIWHMFLVILHYQRNIKIKTQWLFKENEKVKSEKIVKLQTKHFESVENIPLSGEDAVTKFEMKQKELERRKNFSSYIQAKRLKLLEDIQASIS